MYDWNDLKHFLAVARSGTTLAAGRMLRVSQSTVARRISALEAALGTELFEKRPAGYVLTEAGRDLVQAAETVEAAASALATSASSRRREIAGVVRLTTNELYASQFLMRGMRLLRSEYPNLTLEIAATDRRLDLAKGEADIALRAGSRPDEPGLVGRRVAEDRWSVYCSEDYAAEHGMPRSAADLAGHTFAAMDDSLPGGPMREWALSHIPSSAVVVRQNSLSGLFSTIRSGLAVSMMSDFLAASEPELVRCFTPEIETGGEIWLLTHERLRTVPRIRTVMDFLWRYLTSGDYARAGR